MHGYRVGRNISRNSIWPLAPNHHCRNIGKFINWRFSMASLYILLCVSIVELCCICRNWPARQREGHRQQWKRPWLLMLPAKNRERWNCIHKLNIVVNINVYIITAPCLPTSRCWVSTGSIGQALWTQSLHVPASAVDQCYPLTLNSTSCAFYSWSRFVHVHIY